jgi:hypothetical protein
MNVTCYVYLFTRVYIYIMDLEQTKPASKVFSQSIAMTQ